MQTEIKTFLIPSKLKILSFFIFVLPLLVIFQVIGNSITMVYYLIAKLMGLSILLPPAFLSVFLIIIELFIIYIISCKIAQLQDKYRKFIFKAGIIILVAIVLFSIYFVFTFRF